MIEAAVATGSAVILFPLKEMTVGNRQLSLTDGGFLHIVPVDAATSLGATHLIIIMCSEDTKHIFHPEEWDFFQYLGGVLRLGVYGSQTLDYFDREKKMSFIMAKDEKKIGRQDFDGRLYKGKFVTPADFMREGYEDALGKENGFRELSAGELILK